MKGLSSLLPSFDFAAASQQFDDFLAQTKALVNTVAALRDELAQLHAEQQQMRGEIATMRAQLQRLETWTAPTNRAA